MTYPATVSSNVMRRSKTNCALSDQIIAKPQIAMAINPRIKRTKEILRDESEEPISFPTGPCSARSLSRFLLCLASSVFSSAVEKSSASLLGEGLRSSSSVLRFSSIRSYTALSPVSSLQKSVKLLINIPIGNLCVVCNLKVVLRSHAMPRCPMLVGHIR